MVHVRTGKAISAAATACSSVQAKGSAVLLLAHQWLHP